MDTLTPERRSWLMSRIRSKNTRPELLVRRLLHANGYRFRVCPPAKGRTEDGLPYPEGHPDIVIPRCHALIEVRGCFWHRHAGCADATTPKSNRAFWNAKFRRNVKRDAEHEKAWAAQGWNLIVVWACGLAPASREKTFRFILRTLARWEVKKK